MGEGRQSGVLSDPGARGDHGEQSHSGQVWPMKGQVWMGEVIEPSAAAFFSVGPLVCKGNMNDFSYDYKEKTLAKTI